MEKSLDRKLAEIHADPSGSKAFILADAKDADMAFGMAAPGKCRGADGEVRLRTLAEFRDSIRQMVQSDLVDIMLMSVSTNEALAIQEHLFENSPVTPAVRANDTTDIFCARGSAYARQPSLPFRTALLEHAMFGRLAAGNATIVGANLGLYSLTFNNDAELDARALAAYRDFRIEAEQKGFRHFLEVFDPNCPSNPIAPADLGGYINDMIARTLAGVAQAARPLFLKMVYHGPRAMEELVTYDPHLVVGILGGSAGTTYDAFRLLADAQKHGARVALFGRKINHAEHQLSFVRCMRGIVDGKLSAEQAVREYHGALQDLKIPPHRSLADDLVETSGISHYGA